MTDRVLSVIADPDVGRDELLAALRDLGPPQEPPSFWTTIANSAEYADDHRRRAVFVLFRRHVHPPLTVAELARLLDHPTWLADGNVVHVSRLGGKIPVTWTLEDSVFAVGVLGAPGEWAIYLRVRGRLDIHALLQGLRGETAAGDALILECGLVLDDAGVAAAGMRVQDDNR